MQQIITCVGFLFLQSIPLSASKSVSYAPPQQQSGSSADRLHRMFSWRAAREDPRPCVFPTSSCQSRFPVTGGDGFCGDARLASKMLIIYSFQPGLEPGCSQFTISGLASRPRTLIIYSFQPGFSTQNVHNLQRPARLLDPGCSYFIASSLVSSQGAHNLRPPA